MMKILCILLFPNYVHIFSEIREIHILWLHSSILFFVFFLHTKCIFITKLENIIFPSWKFQYFLQRRWKKKYEYRKVIFWTSNVIHRHCYGCSFASFNLISVISCQSPHQLPYDHDHDSLYTIVMIRIKLTTVMIETHYIGSESNSQQWW